MASVKFVHLVTAQALRLELARRQEIATEMIVLLNYAQTGEFASNACACLRTVWSVVGLDPMTGLVLPIDANRCSGETALGITLRAAIARLALDMGHALLPGEVASLLGIGHRTANRWAQDIKRDSDGKIPASIVRLWMIEAGMK